MAASKQITNVILLAALSATAVYLVFTKDAPTTREREAREQNALKVFRRDALTELNFERDGASFRLYRASTDADAGSDDRSWMIAWNGKTERADAFSVDRALGSLEYASLERTIKPEEVNRAQFGLEPPHFRLTMVAGSLRTTFAIGGPAPRPDGAVYIDDNGAVRVAKRSSFDAVDVSPEAFLSRAVVPYLSNDLKQIEILQNGSKVTLEKLAGLSWKLASGSLSGARLDRFLFDRILSSFPDLKADHFLAEAEARAVQKENAPIVVTMVPSDTTKPQGAFSIGGPCPGHPDEVVVIRTAPTTLFACSAKGIRDALQQSSEQYADTRVFSLREDEIEEIALEQGEKKLDLARKNKAWKQRSPVEAEVEADQAKALVKALGTTRGEQLRMEAPDGFSIASMVTVRGPRENEEVRPPETIELSKPGKEGAIWIHRKQDGAYLLLSREQARPFFPRSTALRSTSLIEQPIDKARSIKIWKDGQVLQQLSRKSGGSWTLDLPKGYSIDVGVVANIAENLLHLSAEHWVADSDDGSFGLAKPRFRAEISVEEGDAGEKNYTLLLGEMNSAGVYGRLEGVDGVFLVNRSLEEALSSLAIDLAVFMLDLNETAQVSFKRKEDTVVFDVKGGNLLSSSAERFPPSRLEKIKEILNELRAQSVVHLGAPRRDEGLEKPSLEILVKSTNGEERRIQIGASDVLQSASIFYARTDKSDATYALPTARVRALLDLL